VINKQDEEARRELQKKESRITGRKLLLIVPVMLLFCASMVPLYRQICEVLGISATRAVAENTQVDTSRTVVVEFDASLNRNFDWQFAPLEKQVLVHPGAVTTVHYRVTNRMSRASTGRAVPSFGPIEAGLFINKLECFCFSSQTLQAGETRDMSITFFVSPKLPKEIGMIAFSYTFFDVSEEQKKS
jgi:cytochrome c oxidase assembly protein subunit 11